jgi:hypothetical protein
MPSAAAPAMQQRPMNCIAEVISAPRTLAAHVPPGRCFHAGTFDCKVIGNLATETSVKIHKIVKLNPDLPGDPNYATVPIDLIN